MLIKKPSDIKPSEITPQSIYLKRRQLLQAAAAGVGLAFLPGSLPAASLPGSGKKFSDLRSSSFSSTEKMTAYEDITSYNNFYEFGTSKKDPARRAHTLQTDPWSVTIEGEVEKPGTYTLEDILRPHALEERIYRLRCVEAWSMVVPWVGFPLSDLIKRFAPTSKAKYVEFTTLYDPKQMPGQSRSVLDWPYVEGLRMDEAMHPLTLLAVGLYGEVMPKQNGAPIRLVVPWKYGFKSIKSVVKIRFTATQPKTTWNLSAPREYGFYSNVNPTVDHPRWSQKSERRIGETSLFTPRRKTLMFNGYADQVAHLYKGMDLRKFF